MRQLRFGAPRRFVQILIAIAIIAMSLSIQPAQGTASAGVLGDEVLNILSLTDSYGAAIGTLQATSFYDNISNKDCTQGTFSQSWLAKQYFEARGWNTSLNNEMSCLGYTTKELQRYVDSYRGRNVVKEADVIYVRIGGNDIGFVSRLACMLTVSVLCLTDQEYGDVETSGEVKNRIFELLDSITRDATPGTTVAISNYPYLFGNGLSDFDTQGYWCGNVLGPLTSSSELVAVRNLTDKLNQAISESVQEFDGRNGINFELIDVVETYRTHGLCGSGEDWINGIVADPSKIVHSFHPKQQAYEVESAFLIDVINRNFKKADFDGQGFSEWGQYVGNIVRWEDGTSWLVREDGRHWIPEGDDYLCFVNQGSQVFNLSSVALDSIPDIKHSWATCNPGSSTPVQPQGENVYGNLPLACGVEVPYASTYDYYQSFSHGYAIDLPAPNGVSVVAPASGTVTLNYDAGGYGYYVDIVDSTGTTHRMAHLSSNNLISNGTVEKSQKIGEIGTTGASTGPHVHYEQRRNGVQVEVVLDGQPLVWGTRYTNGGDRITQHKLISGNCSTTSGMQSAIQHIRIGVVRSDGCLWVKEERITASWVVEMCNVADFLIERDRIAVMQENGRLYVKEGGLSASWVLVAERIIDFDLEGDRIGVIYSNNKGYVKQGSLYASWTHVSNGSVDIQLEGNRIGVQQLNNKLFVKSPNVNSRWVYEARSIDSFQLEGNRIIALTTWGNLVAKQGALNASWTVLTTMNPSSYKAVGDRIAIEKNGRLWIKDGGLSATWVAVTDGQTRDYDMTDSRVMTAMSFNMALVKEPNLNSSWVELMEASVDTVDVEAGYIGLITSDGTFYAKAPNVNSSWALMTTNAEQIQFEVW